MHSTCTFCEAATTFKSGTLSCANFKFSDSMKCNEISNLSAPVSAAGEFTIVAVGIGIFKAIHINSTVKNNSWGLLLFNAFGAAMGLALALPWFVLEKCRPGLPCPRNMNIIQAGLWQLYQTSKDIWKLRWSFIYLTCELSLFFKFLKDSTQSISFWEMQ